MFSDKIIFLHFLMECKVSVKVPRSVIVDNAKSSAGVGPQQSTRKF